VLGRRAGGRCPWLASPVSSSACAAQNLRTIKMREDVTAGRGRLGAPADDDEGQFCSDV